MDLAQGLTRRASLAALAVVALVALGGCASNDDEATRPSETSVPSTTPADISADQEFEELEDTYDAQLGVYAVDTGRRPRSSTTRTSDSATHPRSRRCSAAWSCSSAPSSTSTRSSRIPATTWSSSRPSPKRNVATGMSIGELCGAAVSHSDNTATNLLLDEIGGPSGLQEALRENGDDVISTDRYETEMSEASRAIPATRARRAPSAPACGHLCWTMRSRRINARC